MLCFNNGAVMLISLLIYTADIFSQPSSLALAAALVLLLAGIRLI